MSKANVANNISVWIAILIGFPTVLGLYLKPYVASADEMREVQYRIAENEKAVVHALDSSTQTNKALLQMRVDYLEDRIEELMLIESRTPLQESRMLRWTQERERIVQQLED